jgi:diguanylate cyclase
MPLSRQKQPAHADASTGIPSGTEVAEHVRSIAEIAWEALCTHSVAPTPRNFEIWYSYCSRDNPKLSEQLDRLIAAAEPLTPGVLDALFRDFFSNNTDVAAIRDSSRELQRIATEMADYVATDRSLVGDYATTLAKYAVAAESDPATTLQQTTDTLASATTQLANRMRTLEQLLVASEARIGKLEQRLAKSEHEATRDALTGLANRRLFDAAIQHAVVQRSQDGGDLSLLMLDIDDFKQFNDRYGHPMGDSVLRLVARVLSDHLKGRDTAARYGGEEFAIILVGTGLDGAITVGEQIRQLLETRPIVNRASGERFGIVTCSIGAACYRHGETVGDLISRADNALYRAKRTGRNKICSEQPV